ncbi:MAG: energy transducer TonB, partial [Rhodobacteraceae bacterium]|nr:energy transducer TonB [Paracoccaceae bacterium]
PSGPPLTAGETEGLRLAIQECWNVGSLSTDALKVTVVVGVSLDAEAKPLAASIRLISSEGNIVAAEQAYEAARRAIIRCGVRGYGLPVEKYDHWRDIEITFNPEKMRIR